MSTRINSPWTVLRLLEWTTDFFKEKGSDSPRLDAEILLAHARDCPRIALYTAFDDIPSEEERVAFRELVRRRGEGAPVAQLVGYREFYSLRFRVDENVLIPRPETEHLVIEALDQAKVLQSRLAEAMLDRPLQILDVGTGSGAIAVTLAKHLPAAQVTAVDISESALDIARWNADAHQVSDRITFHQSDLLASIPTESQFDLICSNPPYVSQDEYEDLPDTVREFEPREALLAGPTGTEVIDQLVPQAASHLVDQGQLIIELSPMIAETCLASVSQDSRWSGAELIRDLAGHQRILTLQFQLSGD
ncbi:MAG: peptide chain release factor N(5)-glutamine methyltransferase [Planctomycetota bacterium]